jgi:serine O-acetyltransferase
VTHFARYEKLADELRKFNAVPHGALPSRHSIRHFAHSTLSLMFPQFREEGGLKVSSMPLALAGLEIQLGEILTPLIEQLPQPPSAIIEEFMPSLPEIFSLMFKDAEAILSGDPAAKSLEEVIVAYPGFYGIAIYRIAHRFYDLKVPIFPRLLTELAHQFTGIDIHPGAEIGESFCIDHGTGVVVGETTVIGENVKLYQGVTLGALSVQKSAASLKRHPTIEDRVVVYSNATILGGNTVIGHDSVVGGNVWLTSSVPPFSTVYHKDKISMRNQNESENDS